MAPASFPAATFPCGIRTTACSPARAAYAAAEAAVLPVDAQMTVSTPRPTASLIATVMPRSLNEPVGLSPSNFTHNSKPPDRKSPVRAPARLRQHVLQRRVVFAQPRVDA